MNFVNSNQDNIERKVKYAMLRGLGLSTEKSRKIRDFTWRNWTKRVIA